MVYIYRFCFIFCKLLDACIVNAVNKYVLKKKTQKIVKRLSFAFERKKNDNCPSQILIALNPPMSGRAIILSQ